MVAFWKIGWVAAAVVRKWNTLFGRIILTTPWGDEETSWETKNVRTYTPLATTTGNNNKFDDGQGEAYVSYSINRQNCSYWISFFISFRPTWNQDFWHLRFKMKFKLTKTGFASLVNVLLFFVLQQVLDDRARKNFWDEVDLSCMAVQAARRKMWWKKAFLIQTQSQKHCSWRCAVVHTATNCIAI